MGHDSHEFEYSNRLRGRKIRLLFVQPSSPEDTSQGLEVNIVEQFLDLAEFDALSYVWGKDPPKNQILCNGKPFNIGKNLNDALLESRHRGCRNGLWADAICINQKDDVEKTDQVRLMGQIYSKASRTIIWLGPQIYGDEIGVHLIELLWAKRNAMDPNILNKHNLSEDFHCEAWGAPDIAHIQHGNSPWHQLLEIFRHAWFTRVWVIQELVLSSNPVFWRGSKSIDAHALIWMARQIGTKRDLRSWHGRLYNFSDFSPSGMSVFYDNIAETRQIVPLWVNLHSARGMEATDPRDRFFALASISANLPKDFVDYSRTLEQVASQVALMILTSNEDHPALVGLDLLADSASTCYRIQDAKLPSWVPDFFSGQLLGFQLSRYYSTRLINNRHKSADYPQLYLTIIEEDGTITSSVLPKAPFRYDKIKELHLQGAVFDRIKEILPMVDLIKNEKSNREEPESSSKQHIVWAYEEAYQLARRVTLFIKRARILAEPAIRNQNVMSGQSFEAFWRTLLYNRTQFSTADTSIPHSSIGISFGYWYLMLQVICKARSDPNPIWRMLQAMSLRTLAYPFKNKFDQLYSTRRFFVAESGMFGWAPIHAQPGDSLVILKGSRIPIVARPRGTYVWEHIGGCYVHGIMDGELWDSSGLDWAHLRFM